MSFLEWEVSSFHREDFLAAQICQTIMQSVVKHPGRIKLEPYLIKFKNNKPPTKAERAEQNRIQKDRWSFILGGPVVYRKPPQKQ